MSNINYDELYEITVHNQQELDDVPKDYKGHIYVDRTAKVVIRDRYYWRVVACGNSTVLACGNSTVTASGNSTVTAWENSTVTASGNSTVTARGNSTVEARGNSTVLARGNSTVEAWENSTVTASGNSTVTAWGNSTVEARGNSTVEAWENSTVEAQENSTVEAWENSTVTASGNSQVVNRSLTCKINLNGNAREVFMPRNIHEYFDFYGIKHTKTTAIMYKAVRKRNGIYFSDYTPSFKYDIGKFKTENCDADTSNECASGIHIAYLDWTLRFGDQWEDLAILEVRTKIADIVMPDNCDGKVRTSKVKVLREVPLEECGILGKILSQRRAEHG